MKSTISPIFEIPFIQLQPIVNKIAGEPVDSFKVQIKDKKMGPSGICGDYLVPTITYLTKSGTSGDITIFVRRPHRKRPGSLQQHHYEYLSNQNVPIPELYGVITDDEGREVLFLEYLDEIIDEEEFLDDEDRARKFLALMARFNTVKLTLDYIAELGRDMARREWSLNWNKWLAWSMYALDLLKDRAYKDELGKPLKKLFSTSTDELDKLKKLSRELMNRVNKYGKGYLHGDFYPGNMGWRCRNKELVIFDFEDVIIDVRFFDVATYLGAPDIAEKRCDTRYNLAEYYLKQYQGYTGEFIDLEEFLKEIYIIWLSYKSNPWEPRFDASEVWEKATNEQKQKRSEQIYKHLTMLISQLPIIDKNGLI